MTGMGQTHRANLNDTVRNSTSDRDSFHGGNRGARGVRGGRGHADFLVKAFNGEWLTFMLGVAAVAVSQVEDRAKCKTRSLA